MYFDRNATQNAAKRSGSAGMDRRSNAAWVSPQAVKARRPPRSGKSAAPTLAGPRVIGAGFALPRDAGQRPALHKEKARPRGAVAASGAGRVRHALGHGAVSCALVSRSRAMPVRDRRSTRKRRGPGERWRRRCGEGAAHLGMAQCHARWFRAPARCRCETGAPISAFGMGDGRWEFRAPARCRSEDRRSLPAALCMAGSGDGVSRSLRDAGLKTGDRRSYKKGGGPEGPPPRFWLRSPRR